MCVCTKREQLHDLTRHINRADSAPLKMYRSDPLFKKLNVCSIKSKLYTSTRWTS